VDEVSRPLDLVVLGVEVLLIKLTLRLFGCLCETELQGLLGLTIEQGEEGAWVVSSPLWQSHHYNKDDPQHHQSAHPIVN